MNPKRMLPLSGVVFVAVVILAVGGLGGNTPGTDAPAAEVASFYDDDAIQQAVAGFLLAASVPFLVIFGIGLATALSPREARQSSVWELVLIGGTILTGGTVLVVALIHFALVDGAEQGISGGALQALNSLDGNTWVAFNAAFGVMMLGAAGTLLSRTGGYRRLGWIALVLGIALFIPFADFFALLLTAIWIIVISVMMARGAGQALPAAPLEQGAATSTNS